MPAKGLWLAAGLRTPFAKVDGPIAERDAIALSVPVVQAMCNQLHADLPDLVIWGTVAPSLRWSNIAREVTLDAGVGADIPAWTNVLACGTSMAGVFAAAGTIENTGGIALVGGSESMSGIQIGLNQKLSTWLRRFLQTRSLSERAQMLAALPLHDVRLHIPTITNRTTGLSMGEGAEIMANTWHISRQAQDEYALESHSRAVAGRIKGFFNDLVIPVDGVTHDLIPRHDTSLEKLAKLRTVFDHTPAGTLTAGNSSPLTDGAAGVWLAAESALGRLPANLPRVRLIDWEVSAVNILRDGLLMAPAIAIPRLLARNNLGYGDIALWEIHEAFAAQVLCHLTALEDVTWLKDRARVTAPMGRFPRERMNPNGGSVALGHPFGATGARILSQAVKELAAMPVGSKSIVSICTDGGMGTVSLLENA